MVEVKDTNEFYIDDSAIQKDLRILLQSDKIKRKWDELIKSLKENPYRLPSRFVPQEGLKYNKQYRGKDLYHAVIDKSEKDRLFYIIDNNIIVLQDLQYKGVVELIQSLGHDFKR